MSHVNLKSFASPNKAVYEHKSSIAR